MKDLKCKTILQSLHDKVESGEITLRQAAEKMCKAGWTCGYIDLDKTARLINVDNV